MEKIGFIKLYILVSFCFVMTLQAQQNDIPDRPVIESVTVNRTNERGAVTITWSMPDPQISPVNVEEFVLHWYEHHPAAPGNPTSTARPFLTLNKNDLIGPLYSHTFIYDPLPPAVPLDPDMPDPRISSVAFAVSAVSNTPSYSTSLRAYENYNVNVTSFYDSCRKEIRLAWDPYIGWQSNTPPYQPLIGYRVMRIFEGIGGSPITIEEIATLSDKETSYTIRDVETNIVHAYYIEAVRADEVVSTSYRTLRPTDMPRPPSFIEALNTKYNEFGQPEINFRIDHTARTNGYLLSGTSNPNFPFVPIGEFEIIDKTVNITLTDLNNHEKSYYYKLDALHICSGQPYLVTSNVATAMWLSIKQVGLVNSLNWDPYQNWDIDNDVEFDVKYDVYRKIGDNMEEVIATTAGDEQTAREDDLMGQGINESVCYWIRATPMVVGAANRYAISNTVCVTPESEIFIPRAFIPNSIDQNDEYKPTFTFPPHSEYVMVLYDRTGAIVYETTNYENGWNGQLMNRKPASEGVYTYVIRYRTAAGKMVIKNGTFFLAMP